MKSKRVQWFVTAPVYEWFDDVARMVGITTTELAHRMMLYHAGQLSNDEREMFELIMKTVGRKAARRITWDLPKKRRPRV